MAIGPVWEALIHTTSCHLPPLPACSPSAAAWLRSPLMSIFRAGWFLPSKTGNVLWNRKVRLFFFPVFVVCCSKFEDATVCGQSTHARVLHNPLVFVNVTVRRAFLHTCTHSHLHSAALCSRPRERRLIEGLGSKSKGEMTNNSEARPFLMQHFGVDTLCVPLWRCGPISSFCLAKLRSSSPLPHH